MVTEAACDNLGYKEAVKRAIREYPYDRFSCHDLEVSCTRETAQKWLSLLDSEGYLEKAGVINQVQFYTRRKKAGDVQ